MVFDPKKYKAPKAKKLPVILLLDVSGSMAGEKIDNLYDAVNEMIDTFVDLELKETIIDIAIITFGYEINLHTPYTPVKKLQGNLGRFDANGWTPLGTALTMAKDMIEDKDTTPSNVYRPVVVLVSDGQPNDEWRQPLDNFINDGRSKKCQRFAVAIGNDADRSVLEKFTENGAFVFFAQNAKDIADQFKKVTMSISQRATSVNPNQIAKNDPFTPNEYSIETKTTTKQNSSLPSQKVNTPIEDEDEDEDDDDEDFD